MSSRPVIAILIATFVAGFAVAASAATQEYTITVPLTLKGIPASPGQKSITVTCAIGPSSMSYSTGTGDAVGAIGNGKTVVNLTAQQTTMTQDVPVTVTDPGTSSGGRSGMTYLCWGKLSPSSVATPVNFITGPLH